MGGSNDDELPETFLHISEIWNHPRIEHIICCIWDNYFEKNSDSRNHEKKTKFSSRKPEISD